MAPKSAQPSYAAQHKLIETDIKTRTFRPLYLICGTEPYLMQQVKRELKDALLEGNNEANLYLAKGAAADPQDAIRFAETMPFFAERRILLIEDSTWFKTGCDELETYLKDPPDSAVFVFTESVSDSRTRLYKAASSRGRVISCDPQPEEILKKWAANRLHKAGRQFKESTLDRFLAGMGTNMSHISNEMDKLIDYTAGRQEITSRDVDKICSGWLSGRIFDLTDALSERDREKAMRHYMTMLEMEEPPNKILSLIERQFHMMLLVSEMIRRHAGYDMIAAAANLKAPWMVDRYIRWTKRFTDAELLNILERCLSVERALKRGRMDRRIAVEIVICEVTTGQKGGGTSFA